MPRGNPGWVKGGPSPNPAGRPKNEGYVRELARTFTDECLLGLAQIMRCEVEKTADRITAMQILLDRGWGRPTQPISGDADDGSDLLAVSIYDALIDATERINDRKAGPKLVEIAAEKTGTDG